MQAIQITITANCSACTALKARDLDLLSADIKTTELIVYFYISYRGTTLLCLSVGTYIIPVTDTQTDRQTDKKHLLTHTQEGLTNDRNITASTAAIATGAVVNCTARFTMVRFFRKIILSL